MSPTSAQIPEEHQTLAANHDMYERLAKTLDQPDIDADATHSIVLQLAGAPTRSQELGEDIRGNMHLAIVSDASANLSRFLTAVADLAPYQTAHVNGTNVTLAGAIGSTSGGSLTPGPLIDDSTPLCMIEQLDEIGGQTHEAFQQILDASSYSFTKSNYRQTVSASGSILIAGNPKYGNFDQYEPIAEQLNLRPAIHAGVDMTLVNITNKTNSVQTAEDSLSGELARKYLASARTLDPTLTTETTEEINQYLHKFGRDLKDDDLPYNLGINRLRETFIRLSLSHARLRLSRETIRSDATRAINLVQSVLEDIGITPEQGELDADMIEAGTTKSQRDKIKNLKDIVGQIEDEYKHGAPRSEVLDIAESTGMDRSKAEHEVEKLLEKAEVYEPAEDRLRTT